MENQSSSLIELRQRRKMAVWLLTVCAMVFAMVVLGGLTRLTHSGLSMVDWYPVTRWLPPMSEIEWQAMFAKYQNSPQYKLLNVGMTVNEFENIFWLEFVHRLWGRLIGLVFAVPFIIFVARGWIAGALKWKLLLALVLGGLQGVLGWYMVKSGLVDRPDVSQYRLAAHLVAALIIYGYLLWLFLELFSSNSSRGDVGQRPPILRGSVVLLIFAGITISSGAFVAGLDAGLSYNTFPLMGGQLVPNGLLELTPAYLNFFENITTVQFDHRVLAFFVFVISASIWIKGIKKGMSGRLAIASHFVFASICLQVILGILTLLLLVPVGLAALHQANAFILFGAIVWLVFETQRHKV
ncbi:MAG: COX15/CtaA family protein [Rhodospirillales bacterium]